MAASFRRLWAGLTGARRAPLASTPRREWLKSDIINELAAIHSYRTYLEICVPWSGNQYDRIDASMYSLRRRLVYRRHDDWTDGLDIHYASATLEIDRCIQEIQRQQLRFDVILVDPWHEYEPSVRDIEAALELLDTKGTVVVHDCLPPDPALAAPHSPGTGNWCGVTYKAFADLVTARRDLVYCTIDADFGCGVIRKTALSPLDRRGTRPPATLVDEWRQVRGDYAAAYRLYEARRQDLLNIVTVEEFLSAERAGPEPSSPAPFGALLR